MAEANGNATPETRRSGCRSWRSTSATCRSRTWWPRKGLQAGEVQPDVQVQVSLDARKRPADHQYEVITKFKVTSKNKANGDVLFLLELDYGGIFHVEGVADEQLHPFLLIECPRLLFPFVRRIISDVTRDGGFPPLNVDTVDFLALYRQELAAAGRGAEGRFLNAA